MGEDRVGRGLRKAKRMVMRALGRSAKPKPFTEAKEYWERRYAEGGNSGPGSYAQLAEFKAEVLNAFVVKHKIKSVLEFGCGDGNQLSLAKYPKYLGLDVSPTVLRQCIARFSAEKKYSFMLYDSRSFVDREGRIHAELGLSLDVIYHLVEDEVFDAYMRHLFAASKRYVICYASDKDEAVNVYIRHRKFSAWVERNAPGWSLVEHIPNRYPYTGNYVQESFADFYVFERGASAVSGGAS